MSTWARGSKAFGFCDRCGFRYPLGELKSERNTGTKVNNRVCPTCWDDDHPQRFLFRVRTDDREALKDPRPDMSLTQSRNIEWGWNPVRGVSATTSVGDVTIVTT